MRGAFPKDRARSVVTTASESTCAECGGALWITQHRKRFIQRLDGVVKLVERDKRCPEKGCPGRPTIFRPPVDVRLALPLHTFGLDVIVAIGERHLSHGEALRAIGRDLCERCVPIHQTHVGRLFRDFLALSQLARGDDEALKRQLRAQGGIVAMFDGVQFDDRLPVLYLAWDAISGTPLYGERRERRGADDLCPLVARVKAMDVPVVGIVSDKEKGLVPAVAKAFPRVPHQFCHTHFLKNCAKPMERDLSALCGSVARRAERVHKIAKRLGEADGSTSAEKPAPLPEKDLARELCAIVRQNARVSGKAPLEPPELRRHERLEAVRKTVDEARSKGGERRHRNRRHSST